MTEKSYAENFIWRLLERAGSTAVSITVILVLARILSPEEYGTVVLVMAFIALLQVFVDSGVSSALVQKASADELDYSSVFWFNTALCVLLYIGVFFASPLIAAFYGIPELCEMGRAIGVTLVISGIKNVQQAYVAKNMLFKRFFFSSIIGTVLAGAVGIWMAKNGFGAWAIIAQNLLSLVTGTVILAFSVKWHPRFCFSLKRLSELCSSGWQMLVSALCDQWFMQLPQLLIGKIDTRAGLAFYNKGYQFPSMLGSTVNSSLDSVLLAQMADEQDDKAAVRETARSAMRLSAFIMMPMMFGFAACAEPIIRLLITEKWLPCVPLLQIFSITVAFSVINTVNMNAFKAVGKSSLALRLELVKKGIGLALLIAAVFFGKTAMAASLLATAVISLFVNIASDKKHFGYTARAQMSDVLPTVIAALIMGCAVLALSLTGLSDLPLLLVQIPCGVILYFAFAKLFKLRALDEILEKVKEKIKKQ